VFDFLQYAESVGWYQALSIVGLTILGIVVWNDLKRAHAKYEQMRQRVKILEQSVKDSDRVICRTECINLLKSIDENVKKFI
jgi:hypothetical protein